MAEKEALEFLRGEYRRVRGNPEELGKGAELLDAVLSAPDDLLSRDLLDDAFWAANACKKNAKPQFGMSAGEATGSRADYLAYSRKLVNVRRKFKCLPKEMAAVHPNQIGPYAWALYAVAVETEDPRERREMAMVFRQVYDYRVAHGWQPQDLDRRAYDKMATLLAVGHAQAVSAERLAKDGNLIGCVQQYHELFRAGSLPDGDVANYAWKMVSRIWKNDVNGPELRFLMDDFLKLVESGKLGGDENGVRIRHGFVMGLAKRIHALEKGDGKTPSAIPYDVAMPYMQIVEGNCDVVVGPTDFERRSVTSEERANMERNNGGRKVRLKAWPSNVETMVGVAAKCVKTYALQTGMKPGEKLLAFLGGHLDAGEWFGFHYAKWLMLVGRAEEASSYLLKTVEAKNGEAWAWDCLGDSFVKDAEKARACYCRALTCPVHDEAISEAIAKKIHRKLANVLRALGDNGQSAKEDAFAAAERQLPGEREYYLRFADEAQLLLLGDRQTRRFQGVFEKRQEQSFGFVRLNRHDSIFVPPPRTKGLKNGCHVTGVAVIQRDEKKNRDGWCAVVIREQINGG